ncbi:tRNA lysidine(34) synthetase TilS [Rhizobium grahamii]|uniref:tRNA(Ile)-lysidine synthase n=1 Tax=Rhizobium grahamii TaxID=1120045 RepID=A0A5Q0C5K7_9HYPH|nr:MULTISPECIES: tRNA lysidine(34) synthetase TilS [Rhizobium]QFY61206.1 tRNA lysidine(34) synthetase TilS [Rhizobium grahamii]QRM49642.1 tRNA lysidine(34) synthetase TilS [Rhizobium sp. BG6]
MSPDGILSPETAARRFLDSLDRPARILVAISGGSDSTGLLLALSNALRAKPDSSISLCAATVDHALRPESADEARQVAALCNTLRIPHLTKVWRGTKPKAGISAAGREARYRLLAEAAGEMVADIVVTAHTIDDQRETVAMRAERSERESTGIADLVLFDRRVWVARPFLRCLRDDIRHLLAAAHVSWVDDPSNEDIKYERVRIRRRLRGEGGSDEMGSDAGASRSRLAADAAALITRHFVFHPFGLGAISGGGLDVDRDVLEYALGRLAAVFGGQPFAPGRSQLAAVLAFVKAAEPGRMTAARVVFDLRRDGLYLTRESRGILPLALAPGQLGIWDNRYKVQNDSGQIIRVEARLASAVGEADRRLPRSAFKRAMAAFPRILDGEGRDLDPGCAEDVLIAPYFAPFDRFLTRFDFIFADSLAGAFGTRPYPKAPLGLIDGKTI